MEKFKTIKITGFGNISFEATIKDNNVLYLSHTYDYTCKSDEEYKAYMNAEPSSKIKDKGGNVLEISQSYCIPTVVLSKIGSSLMLDENNELYFEIKEQENEL